MSAQWPDFIAVFDDAAAASRFAAALRTLATEPEEAARAFGGSSAELRLDRVSLERLDVCRHVVAGEFQAALSVDVEKVFTASVPAGMRGVNVRIFNDQVGESWEFSRLGTKPVTQSRFLDDLTDLDANLGLACAVQRRNAAVAEHCLARGADPDFVFAGRPVLVTAARTGARLIVEGLLRAGAKVNLGDAASGADDDDVRSPLRWATYNEDARMMQLLLAHGAKHPAR